MRFGANLDAMSVKVWLGIPGGDYAAAVRFSGETLGHEVAFDARNIVDLTAGKGDRIQLFGPGHRVREPCGSAGWIRRYSRAWLLNAARESSMERLSDLR